MPVPRHLSLEDDSSSSSSSSSSGDSVAVVDNPDSCSNPHFEEVITDVMGHVKRNLFCSSSPSSCTTGARRHRAVVVPCMYWPGDTAAAATDNAMHTTSIPGGAATAARESFGKLVGHRFFEALFSLCVAEESGRHHGEVDVDEKEGGIPAATVATSMLVSVGAAALGEEKRRVSVLPPPRHDHDGDGVPPNHPTNDSKQLVMAELPVVCQVHDLLPGTTAADNDGRDDEVVLVAAGRSPLLLSAAASGVVQLYADRGGDDMAVEGSEDQTTGAPSSSYEQCVVPEWPDALRLLLAGHNNLDEEAEEEAGHVNNGSNGRQCGGGASAAADVCVHRLRRQRVRTAEEGRAAVELAISNATTSSSAAAAVQPRDCCQSVLLDVTITTVKTSSYGYAGDGGYHGGAASRSTKTSDSAGAVLQSVRVYFVLAPVAGALMAAARHYCPSPIDPIRSLHYYSSSSGQGTTTSCGGASDNTANANNAVGFAAGFLAKLKQQQQRQEEGGNLRSGCSSDALVLEHRISGSSPTTAHQQELLLFWQTLLDEVVVLDLAAIVPTSIDIVLPAGAAAEGGTSSSSSSMGATMARNSVKWLEMVVGKHKATIGRSKQIRSAGQAVAADDVAAHSTTFKVRLLPLLMPVSTSSSGAAGVVDAELVLRTLRPAAEEASSLLDTFRWLQQSQAQKSQAHESSHRSNAVNVHQRSNKRGQSASMDNSTQYLRRGGRGGTGGGGRGQWQHVDPSSATTQSVVVAGDDCDDFNRYSSDDDDSVTPRKSCESRNDSRCSCDDEDEDDEEPPTPRTSCRAPTPEPTPQKERMVLAEHPHDHQLQHSPTAHADLPVTAGEGTAETMPRKPPLSPPPRLPPPPRMTTSTSAAAAAAEADMGMGTAGSSPSMAGSSSILVPRITTRGVDPPPPPPATADASGTDDGDATSLLLRKETHGEEEEDKVSRRLHDDDEDEDLGDGVEQDKRAAVVDALPATEERPMGGEPTGDVDSSGSGNGDAHPTDGVGHDDEGDLYANRSCSAAIDDDDLLVTPSDVSTTDDDEDDRSSPPASAPSSAPSPLASRASESRADDEPATVATTATNTRAVMSSLTMSAKEDGSTQTEEEDDDDAKHKETCESTTAGSPAPPAVVDTKQETHQREEMGKEEEANAMMLQLMDGWADHCNAISSCALELVSDAHSRKLDLFHAACEVLCELRCTAVQLQQQQQAGDLEERLATTERALHTSLAAHDAEMAVAAADQEEAVRRAYERGVIQQKQGHEEQREKEKGKQAEKRRQQRQPEEEARRHPDSQEEQQGSGGWEGDRIKALEAEVAMLNEDKRNLVHTLRCTAMTAASAAGSAPPATAEPSRSPSAEADDEVAALRAELAALQVKYDTARHSLVAMSGSSPARKKK